MDSAGAEHEKNVGSSNPSWSRSILPGWIIHYPVYVLINFVQHTTTRLCVSLASLPKTNQLNALAFLG